MVPLGRWQTNRLADGTSPQAIDNLDFRFSTIRSVEVGDLLPGTSAVVIVRSPNASLGIVQDRVSVFCEETDIFPADNVSTASALLLPKESDSSVRQTLLQTNSEIHALAYDPNTKRLYVGTSHSLFAVAPETGLPIWESPMPGPVTKVAVAADSSAAYALVRGLGRIIQLDLPTRNRHEIGPTPQRPGTRIQSFDVIPSEPGALVIGAWDDLTRELYVRNADGSVRPGRIPAQNAVDTTPWSPYILSHDEGLLCCQRFASVTPSGLALVPPPPFGSEFPSTEHWLIPGAEDMLDLGWISPYLNRPRWLDMGKWRGWTPSAPPIDPNAPPSPGSSKSLVNLNVSEPLSGELLEWHPAQTLGDVRALERCGRWMVFNVGERLHFIDSPVPSAGDGLDVSAVQSAEPNGTTNEFQLTLRIRNRGAQTASNVVMVVTPGIFWPGILQPRHGSARFFDANRIFRWSIPRLAPGETAGLIHHILFPRGYGDAELRIPVSSDNYSPTVATVRVSPVLNTGGLDSDGDGMPDDFEASHGLNPAIDDSKLDADSDGMTNFGEYVGGTDPTVAGDLLRLTLVRTGDAAAELSFESKSGRGYLVETAEVPDGEAWVSIGTPINGTGALIREPVSLPNNTRFLRLRVMLTPP